MLKKLLLLPSLILTVLASAATAQTAATAPDNERATDRQAIRSHIDKIFKAYGLRDCATIRATHAPNWIGFTNNAGSIMRGLDEYMRRSAAFCAQNPSVRSAPVGDYKITEIDYVFYGDVALVPYVAEVKPSGGPGHKLRSLDVYAKIGGDWNQVGSNIFLHPDTLAAQLDGQPRTMSPPERQSLLEAREAVWRAYFTGDQAKLEKFLPDDTTVIAEPGRGPFENRAVILDSAKKFAAGGAKLVRLEFPQTEIQVYGNTAI